VHPAERGEVRRVREEQRVGVVLRTATEVEARAAGLGPGGGAVVVGLAKRSPWRAAGIRFGDLILAVDGVEVSDPSVVLERIRGAGDRMTVEFDRDGEPMAIEAPLTRREQELRELFLPPLVDHESSRGKSDTSILLGLFRYESTMAAWRVRLLWFIWFGGGDADELLEVDS
jgi:C-terminal processing protease CtpA/Prc